jgi:hypothetical protein
MLFCNVPAFLQFIYTAGLAVAVLYHFLQVYKPGGLGDAKWLGLPGAGGCGCCIAKLAR